MSIYPFIRFVMSIIVFGLVYGILKAYVAYVRGFAITKPTEMDVLFMMFAALPAIVLFGSGIRLIMKQQKKRDGAYR